MTSFSLSGDWTEILPGVRVRLQDAPNEEDMGHYDPRGVVILQVESEDAKAWRERARKMRQLAADYAMNSNVSALLAWGATAAEIVADRT